MTDLYLRFKLRVEVGENEMQTCIYVNECQKFFFQGGPVVDFPGVAKKTAFFYGYTTFRSGPFGLAVSVSEPIRSEPFWCLSRFVLAHSVMGRFDRDISVHKELMKFVKLFDVNEYPCRINMYTYDTRQIKNLVKNSFRN